MAKSRKKPRRQFKLTRLLWRLFFLVVLVFVGIQLWFASHVVAYRFIKPGQTAFMDIRLTERQAKNPKAELWHEWVDYGNISLHVKRAVVAAEDSKFVNHRGFDWDGIKYAMEKNLDKGKLVAGGSTISQQLAKNLFLSGDKSVVRKGQEAAITLMLEGLLSKRRILELYLNVAEWGDGVFGIQAAAWHYYNKPAAALSAREAARLASMLPNPVYHDRNPNNRQLSSKASVIEKRMLHVWVPS